MIRAFLIAGGLLLIATAANSDGISSNFIGRDVFGGVSFTGKITPPPSNPSVLLINTGSALLINTGSKFLIHN